MIYKSAAELIGKTPMLELTNFEKKEKIDAKIIAKLEYFNPAGSAKDRVATVSYTHLDVYKRQSLLSVIVFNYFFTEPRYTLDANHDYPITFLIMLLTSVISSTLATRVKKQARQASQKAYYTEILMSSNKKLQQGHDDEEIRCV